MASVIYTTKLVPQCKTEVKIDSDNVALIQLNKCASILIQWVYAGFGIGLPFASLAVEGGQSFEPLT